MTWQGCLFRNLGGETTVATRVSLSVTISFLSKTFAQFYNIFGALHVIRSATISQSLIFHRNKSFPKYTPLWHGLICFGMEGSKSNTVSMQVTMIHKYIKFYCNPIIKAQFKLCQVGLVKRQQVQQIISQIHVGIFIKASETLLPAVAYLS